MTFEQFGKVAIKWLGHACFLIVFSGGTRIVTDPFDAHRVGYRPVTVTATAVTVSHHHSDHDGGIGALQGTPIMIQGVSPRKVKQVTVTGLESLHWQATKDQGRGKNTIYRFEGDGVRIVHLGDIGRPLTPEQVKQLGRVDVLMVPVGGGTTLAAVEATRVVAQLKPRVVIPMHYGQNGHCRMTELAGVEPFLKGKKDLVRLKTDTVELDPKKLPARTTIFVPAFK
jgi:L-ascorbate metabolism protein UlaG (beta-lactamase superfamily)